MTDAVLIDTWGWLTLNDAGERQHQAVATFYRTLAVMQEFNLARILTEDAHFIQVGLGFERVPMDLV
jgi:predicted nucleic acid-binding protein